GTPLRVGVDIFRTSIPFLQVHAILLDPSCSGARTFVDKSDHVLPIIYCRLASISYFFHFPRHVLESNTVDN
ncbi:hypothetical protein MKX03_016934, partial [Papaver bracteatum]